MSNDKWWIADDGLGTLNYFHNRQDRIYTAQTTTYVSSFIPSENPIAKVSKRNIEQTA